MPATVVSKDGTSIALWRSGRGRPLVLVHGTLADHSRWDRFVALVERRLEAWAINRRGYGESGDTPPYELEREAEDVAAVVEAAARAFGGDVDLFGHSFGALCALEAARQTKKVRRLVLYEPSLLADPSATGFAAKAERLLAQGRRDDVVTLLFREVLKMSEPEVAELRRQPAWKMRVQNAHLLVREDRVESAYRFQASRFSSLRAPVLLLAGSESPAFLKASTQALIEGLPDVRDVELAGQQHLALTQAPEKVTEAVMPFLK